MIFRVFVMDMQFQRISRSDFTFFVQHSVAAFPIKIFQRKDHFIEHWKDTRKPPERLEVFLYIKGSRISAIRNDGNGTDQALPLQPSTSTILWRTISRRAARASVRY